MLTRNVYRHGYGPTEGRYGAAILPMIPTCGQGCIIKTLTVKQM